MNIDNKQKWVNKKLILNLPPISITVSDTASYHSVLVEETSYHCVNMWKDILEMRWLYISISTFSFNFITIIYTLLSVHLFNIMWERFVIMSFHALLMFITVWWYFQNWEYNNLYASSLTQVMVYVTCNALIFWVHTI
jgi:hypothetical protein